jgi:Ca2+-binding RTX toxin-like protein
LAKETGDDRLDGGAGDDELVGGPGRFIRNVGSDFLRLEPVRPTDTGSANGNDTIIGGDGVDTASYVNRAGPQMLSVDGEANDGSSGESDTIESDVESIVGGLGPDLLQGSSGDEWLDGGPGADTLRGGAGRDSLTGGLGDFADRLEGGSGRDQLAAGGGDDDLYGDPGDDRLEGGGGEDYLDGGAGSDAFEGGNGNDFLHARDQSGDARVNCGAKIDFAVSDGADRGAECERVDRSTADRPLVGKTVSIRRIRGAPEIGLPETARRFPLPNQIDAPVGSILDTGARGDSAVVTVAGRSNVVAFGRRRAPTASAVVSGGRVRVHQGKSRHATADLQLAGGRFAACAASNTTSDVSAKTVRAMTVRSDGRFRTRGRNSVTVGQRAVWVVRDRCDGTVTQTVHGTSVVTTKDGKRRIVKQGARYVAKP